MLVESNVAVPIVAAGDTDQTYVKPLVPATELAKWIEPGQITLAEARILPGLGAVMIILLKPVYVFVFITTFLRPRVEYFVAIGEPAPLAGEEPVPKLVQEGEPADVLWFILIFAQEILSTVITG